MLVRYLVIPFNEPGWAPIFLAAPAIVVDMGACLARESIMAREDVITAVAIVGIAATII
jgi:phosphoenolpyruvate synthase/pyruvate phosphate dikinase